MNSHISKQASLRLMGQLVKKAFYQNQAFETFDVPGYSVPLMFTNNTRQFSDMERAAVGAGIGYGTGVVFNELLAGRARERLGSLIDRLPVGGTRRGVALGGAALLGALAALLANK